MEYFLKAESCLNRNTSFHTTAKFPDPRNSYNQTHIWIKCDKRKRKVVKSMDKVSASIFIYYLGGSSPL